jgi:hypothetical protein
MKKIIVMVASPGLYLVTVTDGRQERTAEFGSTPESYSAKDLAGALTRLGADQLSASRAATEAEKQGSWMMDINE